MDASSGAPLDQHERYEQAFTHAPIATGIVSPAGDLQRTNAALAAILDGPCGSVLRRTIEQQVRRRRSAPRESWQVERRLRPDDGRPLHVLLSFTSRGLEGHVIVQAVDVTEAREREERLQRLAEREPLTDLWNRRRFAQELGRQLARCKRHGEVATLAVLDLDGLKQVNDRFGHKGGDAVLRHVAGALGGRVRASDSLARIGGDEFAVLLASTGPAEARSAVSGLCLAVAETPCHVGGALVEVRISAGYVVLDAETQDEDAAFVAADAALYRAKAAGDGGAVGAH